MPPNSNRLFTYSTAANSTASGWLKHINNVNHSPTSGNYPITEPVVHTPYGGHFERECDKCATCQEWCPRNLAVRHMDDHVHQLQRVRKIQEATREQVQSRVYNRAPEGGESSFLAPPSGIRIEDIASPEDVAQFDYEAFIRRQMQADFYSYPMRWDPKDSIFHTP